LAGLREAHVFLFCHKTPESPRNLVEALISGCPIVGYASDFAAELTSGGGGEFVPVGDQRGLAERLCRLASQRPALVALTRAAAESGKRFNDVAVFRHRSELIKKYL
jgi:glycosyltransferase involved in cell wall biosynthesis